MADRRLFVQFTKIDEEKREVAGRLTQEVVDRDGEIWDYDASTPHMKAWSDSFKKATDGKSLGNLRAMHRNISAGKLTAIDFNDTEKAVDIVAKVVDDDEWNKVQEGLYTGFSLGGGVVRSWRAPGEKHKRFEVRPNEASLADYPCVPTATFDYVKIGGSVETRRFNKTVDGAEGASSTQRDVAMTFADVTNKRLPIATPLQTRVSLAMWGKTALREKYPEAAQAAISEALIAAAAEHRIPDVSEKTMKSGEFTKGLYDVGQLASTIQSLAWMQQCAASEKKYEGDASTVPDQMNTAIAQLCETLGVMVDEETDELLAVLGAKDPDGESEKVAGSAAAGAPAGATSSETPAAGVADPAAAAANAGTAEKIEKVAGNDFQKALAKKHVAALGALVDHAKAVHTMLGDHVEKMAGFCKDMGADDGAADDTSEKVASSEFQKVTGERDSWEKRAKQLESELAAATEARTAAEAERDTFKKTAETLAETGAQLAAAVEVRKGKLVAVDRGTDGAAALSADAKSEKTAGGEPTQKVASGEVNRDELHGSFKTSFAKAHAAAASN